MISQFDWPDSVFTVARAMARYHGHDPDQSVVAMEPPVLVLGKSCAVGPAIPIWHLYAPLAQVAVDEMTKKIKG